MENPTHEELPVTDEENSSIEKPTKRTKKDRSPAQQASWEKALAVRKANREKKELEKLERYAELKKAQVKVDAEEERRRGAQPPKKKKKKVIVEETDSSSSDSDSSIEVVIKRKPKKQVQQEPERDYDSPPDTKQFRESRVQDFVSWM